MIIIGFPGIGKSTVTRNNPGRLIDLESSMFNVDKVKPEYWYKQYVQVAIDLELQGYTVFISSHKNVRDYLLEIVPDNITIKMIYPSYELEKDWIKRIEERYHNDPSIKNQLALANVMNNFKSQTLEMSNYHRDRIKHEEIKSINYELKTLL